MTYRLATSFIALSAALATPALADVSATDVFSNQQALFTAFGATLDGDLSDGTLADPTISMALPQGAASLLIKTEAAVSMTDNTDGTVTIEYPSPMTISIAGDASSEGAFAATATVTHDGYTVTASGTPGDISYASNAQNLQISFGNITVDAADDIEDAEVEGVVTLSEYSGTSHVVEGNLIEYVSDMEIGTTNADFTLTEENIISTSTQTTLPMTSSIQASLPVGGSDMMNLSAALRDGLSVVLNTTGEGSSSSSITMLDGEQMNSQETTTGAQEFDLTFDENGLAISGGADGFTMLMNDPLIFPADLEFGIGGISMDYDIPINASDVQQDFRVATGLTDITIGDAIWDMFDPEEQLPRDPAEISFDITGLGTNSMDLLDIAAMMGLMAPPPIQVDEVTIESLRIAAVGAEATATGSATFDWTDFQTIPGIARPEGSVTVNLSGANALMDRLVEMGFIPEADLMMPRMMMGMFATPVGDDELESVLEINEEGHVLANGQRLR